MTCLFSLILILLSASLCSAQTPQQAWLQSVADSAEARTQGLISIRGTFSGAELSASATPTPTVTIPPGAILVGPTRDVKSIDSIDLNAKAGVTYIIEGTIRASRKQTIKKPRISVQGYDNSASIDVGVKWKQALLTFTDQADGGSVKNLIICGHDGGEFVNLQGTEGFTVDNVNQFVHPGHKGGVTILTARNSKGLTVINSSTQRVARYGVYLGGELNDSPTFRGLDFGPCEIVEDEHLSGKINDSNTLHGGGWSEHCLRVYNVRNLVIDKCKFDNAGNKDGKQAVKVMSGTSATITDSQFLGSTRWGRDVNDPQTYTLKNAVITRCTFSEWLRIDPGTDGTITDSTLKSLDVQPGGKVKVVNTMIGGVKTNKTVQK